LIPKDGNLLNLFYGDKAVPYRMGEIIAVAVRIGGKGIRKYKKEDIIKFIKNK